MSIEAISRANCSDAMYAEGSSLTKKDGIGDGAIFNLEFKPEAFGGKITNEAAQTSVFDSWDW